MKVNTNSFASKVQKWLNFLILAVALSLSLLPAATLYAQNDSGTVSAAQSEPYWLGQYWNNRTLNGNPVVERDEVDVNFNWGAGSPDPSVNSNRFSARWTRYFDFSEGLYDFVVSSDDGVRLFIDDQLVLSKWFDHGARSWLVQKRLSAGVHLLRVEYYDNVGPAQVQVYWTQSGAVQPPVAPPPAPPTQPVGNWRAEYFNSRDLSGSPVIVQDESEINYDWRWKSPYPGTINTDYFSIRWSRTVNLAPGNYRFTMRVDDGARLYVSNRLLIDAWREQPANTYTADVYLSGGPTPLRVEYFDNSGEAVIQVNWQALSGGGVAAPLPTALPSAPVATPIPTVTPPIPGYSGGAPPPNEQPRILEANWAAQYYNSTNLSDTLVLTRNEGSIDYDWGGSSPATGVPVDNFSVRWTATVALNANRYRFTTETDDGVRLYVDGRLVIDQWRTQTARHSADIEFRTPGNHTIVMEFYEGGGNALARLFIQESRPPVGNLITCVPPQPTNYAWIKIYRLDGNGQWYSIGKGIGSINATGFLKVDGLPVDVGRFGWNGEPYRIEQVIDSRVVRSVGNYQAGEPEFRIRPWADNYTPWGCPR